jgi:hypothetical protein
MGAKQSSGAAYLIELRNHQENPDDKRTISRQPLSSQYSEADTIEKRHQRRTSRVEVRRTHDERAAALS